MSDNGTEEDEIETLLRKWDKAEVEKHKLMNVMFVASELLELALMSMDFKGTQNRVWLVRDYINKHLPEKPAVIMLMADSEPPPDDFDDIPF